MKFVTYGFTSLAVLATLSQSGCKSRQSSSIKTTDVDGVEFAFTEEILPFNRIPLKVIERDTHIFQRHGWPIPPKIQPVQTYAGVAYGIRLIAEEDLAEFVRPGDIAVDYSPIDNPQNMVFESKIYKSGQMSEGNKQEEGDVGIRHMILVGLGEKGMNHAKLVVKRGQELCHIDSPDVMSDCKWEGFMHFFRVETDDETRAKVQGMSDLILSRPSAYDYDTFLFTDIYVKGVASVQQQMFQFANKKLRNLPPFYCSELPFTFYSLALGKNLFDTGFNMMDFAKQIADLKSEPKFAPFINDELMQQSLTAFVQQASTVPETVRPMLAGGIKQLLANGYVGSGMRYLVRQYYPSLVLPQHFMTAAVSPEKVPGTRIVYIGSMEQPSVTKNRAYFSSLVYETGKAAVNNYLQRVRTWWNSALPPKDNGDFMLHDADQEGSAPTYLEPDYSR
jgi:hypothetical protein